MDFICRYTCSYRTNSGFCGRTGGAENCQQRRFLGYDSETRRFIFEPVAAGNIIVKSLQTNADRIRSMSDEELAELIGDNIDCAICRKMHDSDDCPKPYPGNCYDVWLDWLRQEASDG